MIPSLHESIVIDLLEPARSVLAHDLLGPDSPVERAREAHQLQQIAKRLAALLEEADSILTHSAARPESRSGHVDETRSDHIQDSLKQLMAARTQWEEDRRAQAALLARDQAELAAAWQSLESEERRLLGQRSVKRKPDGPPDHSAGPAMPASVLPAPNELTDQLATHHGPLTQTSANANAPDMILQYQRLRREMQKHSQRTRR